MVPTFTWGLVRSNLPLAMIAYLAELLEWRAALGAAARRWCSRMESNHRPPPYQGGALPTELREREACPGGEVSNDTPQWSGRRESNPHHQLGRLRFYH